MTFVDKSKKLWGNKLYHVLGLEVDPNFRNVTAVSGTAVCSSTAAPVWQTEMQT